MSSSGSMGRAAPQKPAQLRARAMMRAQPGNLMGPNPATHPAAHLATQPGLGWIDATLNRSPSPYFYHQFDVDAGLGPALVCEAPLEVPSCPPQAGWVPCPWSSSNFAIPIPSYPQSSPPDGSQSEGLETSSLYLDSSHGTSSLSSISARSTLSPINTEFQSPFDGATGPSSCWPRGQSPRQSLTAAVPTALAGPDSSVDLSADAEEPVRSSGPQSYHNFLSTGNPSGGLVKTESTHAHKCSWAGCQATSFNTRDGLNWHVKAEHLLICPVLGCCEGNFQSKKILDSHLRVAHSPESLIGTKDASLAVVGTIRPTLPTPPPTEATHEDESTPKAGPPSPRRDSPDEVALKKALSIATSKKRCREQLRSVMERRAKRAAVSRYDGVASNLSTPRSTPSSPQDLVRCRSPRPTEPASFPLVWEHGVLPFLIEYIPKWCGPGHVISVTRGKNPNGRRICIMAERKISRARRVLIAAHVKDLLPATYRQHTTFFFSTGEVKRLVWARGLGPHHRDEVCRPRNPFCYRSPCMGDSIGTVVDDGESTATLGPSLVLDGGNYWLANFHPFVDIHQTRDTVAVEHPSPRDRERCAAEGHDALLSGELTFKLGDIAATSGIDMKTARLSHDPYWEEMEKDAPFVITDWTLISSNRPRRANMLRRAPSTTSAPRTSTEAPVTRVSPVVPLAAVVTAGRTSGHQRGQVCEVPAYLDGEHSSNRTGYATREWFIEEPFDSDDEEGWIRGGVGVEGDSGASVVDAETNALVGQLWGRNAYHGAGPRHAFFTPFSDVLDDIQERCGQQGRPRLPQYRDEGERWAVYPVCMPCFDLAVYLAGSRRTSRESLRSMIGGAGSGEGGGGRRGGVLPHDLTSSVDLTELLTPKDTQSYWVRHAGPDDPGLLSHPSAASPSSSSALATAAAAAKMITDFGIGSSQAVSPRVVTDMRSPYATCLDEGDLYDAEYAAPNHATGKRAALPLARSASNGGSKRRRVG